MKTFFPDDFLAVHASGIRKSGKYADVCPPNIYPPDWDKISAKYRASVNYQCEENGCPFPDLSGTQLSRYLHTHHVSLDKTNNEYANLKALCIYCHAKQPGHEQVKGLPDYKAYKALRGLPD